MKIPPTLRAPYDSGGSGSDTGKAHLATSLLSHRRRLHKYPKVGEIIRLEASHGGERKQGQLVSALHLNFREEFDRISKLGVKFDMNSLRHLGLHIFTESRGEQYNAEMIIPLLGPVSVPKSRWIHALTNRLHNVNLANSGRHRLSLKKEIESKIQDAAHLGTILETVRLRKA